MSSLVSTWKMATTVAQQLADLTRDPHLVIALSDTPAGFVVTARPDVVEDATAERVCAEFLPRPDFATREGWS